MNASPISSTPQTASPGLGAPVSSDDAQSRFLTLLVTQMKNQDPLNPLDNAAVTSQMAQLSTVSGINKLNDTLASMKSDMQSSSALQATSMIGRTVLAPGNSLELGSAGAPFGVNLAGAADAVQVEVRDAGGAVVQTITLGATDAGVATATWDGSTANGGRAPAGEYSFSATATRGGDAVPASALAYARVESISTGPQGTRLHLSNQASAGLDQISQII